MYADRGDVALVTVDHTNRLWRALCEVVESSTEIDTDDEAVTAPRWPDDAHLLVGNADDTFIAHAPGLCRFARFDVPKLDLCCVSGLSDVFLKEMHTV